MHTLVDNDYHISGTIRSAYDKNFLLHYDDSYAKFLTSLDKCLKITKNKSKILEYESPIKTDNVISIKHDYASTEEFNEHIKFICGDKIKITQLDFVCSIYKYNFTNYNNNYNNSNIESYGWYLKLKSINVKLYE